MGDGDGGGGGGAAPTFEGSVHKRQTLPIRTKK